MFCTECGKKAEENQKFCTGCGAKLVNPMMNQEPAQEVQKPEHRLPVYQLDDFPEEQTAPAEQPTPVETIQLNTSVEEPEKPKKNRKRAVVLPIVAAILVVAILVSVVSFVQPVRSFFLRNLGSAQSYQQHVEENAANEMVGSVSDVYGAFVENLKDPAVQAFKGKVHIELGDALLDLMQTAMEESGAEFGADFSWLSDVIIHMYSAEKDGKMQMDMGLVLGDVTLATLSVLSKNANGEMYIGIPELSDVFLQMPMQQMHVNVNVDAFPSTEDILADLEKHLISEEKLNEVLNKYVQIVLDAMQDAEKGTENVEVDGITQKLNVISTTLTEEDLINILTAILEDVQKDEEILDMVIGIAETIAGQTVIDYEEVYDPETDSYYYEPVFEQVDMKDTITDGLEDVLDTLEEALDDADEDNCIHITTYVDNSDNIVGRTIVIEGEDMDDVELSYITVWNKNEFAFQAELDDLAEIEGSGERNDDLFNATYELSVQGQDVLTLEVVDYDEKAAEEGNLKVTLVIRPDDKLVDEMMDQMDASLIGSIANLSDPGLKLSFDSTEQKAEVGLGIILGDSLLLGYTVSLEPTEMKDISMPDEFVDLSNAEELQNWMMNLNFDALLSNLEKAGVPEEYLELLESLIGSMDGGYTDVPSVDTGY